MRLGASSSRPSLTPAWDSLAMTEAPQTRADMNWFAVLAHHATRTPQKAITVFDGETTTYEEMAQRVLALDAGLTECGVGRCGVVALLSYNCPEF